MGTYGGGAVGTWIRGSGSIHVWRKGQWEHGVGGVGTYSME